MKRLIICAALVLASCSPEEKRRSHEFRMACMAKGGIVVMVHYDRETCVRPVDVSKEVL